MITQASGYRNVGSGMMANEGSGYYWSASPNGAASGLYLLFVSGGVNPQGFSNRGFGFPLRCIQGFTLHGWNRCLDRSGVAKKMITGASGNRSVGSGTMAYEGSNGYYWSSSPSSAVFGIYLFVYSGGVSPQHNDGNRGSGFPLRCIQEFALHGANRCSRQNGGTEGQEGMTADTSGYRNVGSGAMTDEGGGYYWPASPSGASFGVYLSFSSAYVSPQGSTYRGSGFPLRCIQELALHGANFGTEQE